MSNYNYSNTSLFNAHNMCENKQQQQKKPQETNIITHFFEFKI